MAAEYGAFHAVVAHSLGAMATMIAKRHGWIDVQRFAFIAPVTEVHSQLDQFLGAPGVGPSAHRYLDGEVGRHTGLGLDEFAYSGRDASGRAAQLIAVHDLQDRFVPHAATAALVSAWPGARLVTTDGLGHVRILADLRGALDLAEGIAATSGAPWTAG